MSFVNTSLNYQLPVTYLQGIELTGGRDCVSVCGLVQLQVYAEIHSQYAAKLYGWLRTRYTLGAVPPMFILGLSL